MKRKPLTAFLAVLAFVLVAPIVVHPVHALLPQNQPGPTDPAGSGSCSQSDCAAKNCNCGDYPGYDFTGWCGCSSIYCQRYCSFEKKPN